MPAMPRPHKAKKISNKLMKNEEREEPSEKNSRGKKRETELERQFRTVMTR